MEAERKISSLQWWDDEAGGGAGPSGLFCGRADVSCVDTYRAGVDRHRIYGGAVRDISARDGAEDSAGRSAYAEPIGAFRCDAGAGWGSRDCERVGAPCGSCAGTSRGHVGAGTGFKGCGGAGSGDGGARYRDGGVSAAGAIAEADEKSCHAVYSAREC